MSTTPKLPIASAAVADWATVIERAIASREAAEMALAAAASAADIDEASLAAFESGRPVLGMFDLQQLASVYGTTLGAWMHQDEPPLFRGEDHAASKEAEEIALALMTQFLAAEALAG